MAMLNVRGMLGFVLLLTVVYGASSVATGARSDGAVRAVGGSPTSQGGLSWPGAIEGGGTIEAARTPPALRIRIGDGIGPVRLGQTVAQVRTLLGSPRKTSRFTWSSTRKPGIASTYRFRSARLNVLFGSGRVVSVSTVSPVFRTAGGIGVGSPEARVAGLSGFSVNSCTGGYSRFTLRADTDFHIVGGRVTEATIARRGWVTC